MPDPIPGGKLPAELLRAVLPSAATTSSQVVLGPALGEDAAAIELDAGTLVVAADPITLTGSEVGSFVVDINANDVAVTGVAPRWFLAVVLLPAGTTPTEVDELFEAMYRALERVGAELVGGHTEVTGAVSQPVVIGQMLGHRTDHRIVRTGGARPGDVVVQVGPAPVEGAAVLAGLDHPLLEQVDPDLLAAAQQAASEPGISVVAPALLAADLGATAMHDPTEGGLAAGLHELAAAAEVSLEVDGGAVAWFDPGRAVCDALGADPWATLASGCLLASFGPQDLDRVVRELAGAGHTTAPIARVAHGSGVRLASGEELDWPERDEVARLADA